ncbi:Gfo/Idh/MocA family oxidoreductase [bacterium]|nr:Gfo/Idh/MocA family oxidoreductase [bacterium]
MVEKLRTAVIGLGSMGKNHVRVLSEIRESELVAVSDCDKKKLAEIEKKYKLKGYANYKEMLEKEDLDMVSVVVPTSLHSKVAVDVMNKKINCLVEKPIADTIENAKKIIKAAEKNDVKLTVGHIERFNPAVLELKKRINEIGKIWEIHVMRRGPFPERIRDVGVVIDLAVHDLDVMRFITGSKVKRVYAEIEKNIHTTREDMLDAILRFENNAVGILNVNWLTPTKIRDLIVIGENGMFKLNYITQNLEFHRSIKMNKSKDFSQFVLKSTETDIQKLSFYKEEPLKRELKSFLSAIKEGKEPEVSGKDGLEALRLAKKILEAGEKKKLLC